jgi:hypothetical protein
MVPRAAILLWPGGTTRALLRHNDMRPRTVLAALLTTLSIAASTLGGCALIDRAEGWSRTLNSRSLPTPAPIRPVLRQPIRPHHRPRPYRPLGEPTATTERDGIRVEIWIEDRTLEQGQVVRGSMRVTNLGPGAMWHEGIVSPLACPPLAWRSDGAGLLDPGRNWQGAAGRFKRLFLRQNPFVETYLGWRHRGPDGCGDIGYRNQLPEGASFRVPLRMLPHYELRSQPLPGGTWTTGIGFSYFGRGSQPRASRSGSVIASTTFTLAGTPVDYPSPGRLVDVALDTPGFVEWLESKPFREWVNTSASYWPRPPYPVQARFDHGRKAPDGVLEIGLFADGPGPLYGMVLVDPWTAESFGFHTQ